MNKKDKKSALKNSEIDSWIPDMENLCEIQTKLKNEIKKTFTYPEIAEHLQEFYPQIWEKMKPRYANSVTLNKKKTDANSNKKNDTDSLAPSNIESMKNGDMSDKTGKIAPIEPEPNDNSSEVVTHKSNDSYSYPAEELHINEQSNKEPTKEGIDLNKHVISEPQEPDMPPYQDENLGNKFDYIINYLQTLDKNINFLKTDINEVKKSVSKISTTVEGQDKTINENAAEFIKIYSSEKSRKTITVNNELFAKIIEQIQENTGIKNNDSKAIDIALLKVLYLNRK